jgi:hypothetical protein
MLNHTPVDLWDVSRRQVVATWRASNSILDTVFYDVGALTTPERAGLSAYVSAEGSVLVVHPRHVARPIRVLTPAAFVDEQLQETSEPVTTVAIAGVGSSALGTAALARNVADWLGAPVAGIVSGYGLADVVAEALGGWFVFGAKNALREMVARLLDASWLKDHVRDPESHEDMKAELRSLDTAQDRFLYGSPDSTTMLYLLLKLGGRLRLLVGHSKGNYSIENALEGWVSSWPSQAMAEPFNLRIVTLGAVIWFPSECVDLHQFLGRVDYFGMLNSRIFVQRIAVPGVWHSLNRALPGHMSVADALEAVKALPVGVQPDVTAGAVRTLPTRTADAC